MNLLNKIHGGKVFLASLSIGLAVGTSGCQALLEGPKFVDYRTADERMRDEERALGFIVGGMLKVRGIENNNSSAYVVGDALIQNANRPEINVYNNNYIGNQKPESGIIVTPSGKKDQKILTYPAGQNPYE